MKLNVGIRRAFESNLKRAGGNAGRALGDLTNVRQFLTGNSLFASLMPVVPIYLVVIFMFHPWLGVFAVVQPGPLLTRIIDRVGTRKPLAGRNVAQVPTCHNNLRNAEVIEAMGMLDNLRGRWMQMRFPCLAE
jgi:ATP-binding cassette subfamily C exporter for protease/lipase